MSYDIHLEIDTGGSEPHEVFWKNITWNVSPMMELAGMHPRDWDGKPAGEVATMVSAGLTRLMADPKPFIAVEAANGWGTYRQLVPWVEEMLQQLIAHPNTTVRVT